MDELLNIVTRWAPEKALVEITKLLGVLLAGLDDTAREEFLMNLIGQSEGDKVSGMVHL